MPSLDVIIKSEGEQIAEVKMNGKAVFDMLEEDEALEEHLTLWIESGFEQLGPGQSTADSLGDSIIITKLNRETLPAFLYSLDDLGYEWDLEDVEEPVASVKK